MARTSRHLIVEADRRFPIRIRVGQPPNGFGKRLTEMYAWLDANCGADGWVTTPSSIPGVVQEAAAFYFDDVWLAAAFVARWCAGGNAEFRAGAFVLREDEPKPRIGIKAHG